jgi:PAS domain S-box-containing protein
MKWTGARIDILCVDDRLDGLIALEAVLASDRVNVVRAHSGREALALLPHYDFAVILMDVQMPEMDGFETVALIKEMEQHKHIPILFVTAINNDDRYIYRGYETGAVDYVFKPFDPMVLKSKVEVFMELFRQARRIRDQEARLLEVERSERIRQLAELEVESLRRYQSLADAVPHIICRTRSDSTPDYFNRAWVDYTGISLEASLGSGWHRAFHCDDLARVLRTWVDALISGNSFETDCRLRRADGVYRYHLIRAVPERRGASGEVIAWIGTAIDIDDRIQSEKEMIRAKEEAESASLAKTQFLANVSHEIRTPLSAIIGFSELLLNPSQTPEDRLQGAATIHRNGQQLLHLINEILDISKVESGKMELDESDTDLLLLLREMISLFELKAAEKGLRFEVAVEGKGVPSIVRTDPMRLRQILVNMIANAVKFTEKGSVRMSVLLRQDSLIFRVRDTGVGIPSESRARLFQPFSQVDNSTSRRFGGTGLGLVLSKRFAESLGGDVSLVESSALGSVFEARVHCAAVGTAVLPVGTHAMSRSRVDAPVEPDAGALSGFSLLLVDDALDNQVLISRFLRMAGASVQVLGGGREAVAAALSPEGERFDLILMDIQMPEMDGHEATRAMRAQGWVKPIIALTAHALRSEREKCLESGFDDHFTKPIDRMKLISCLAQWLTAPERMRAGCEDRVGTCAVAPTEMGDEAGREPKRRSAELN